MIPLPRISVITPCFNSVRTIEQTIVSVLQQNYPDLEHIVMDAGSTDGTVDLLKKYPHLKWFSEKDEGLYDAMNKGIARSTGEWIVILNSDDCFRSEALTAVTVSLARHPEWEAFFGDFVAVDSNGQEIYRRAEAGYSYTVLRYWQNYICHQTLFVRKSVYDRLGVYRHKDFRNSCDYEFLLRLGRAHCRIGHVPAYLVDFRFHPFGMSTDLRVIRNIARENGIIQQEYGVATHSRALTSFFARVLRQLQKIFRRGKCDLISGHWLLKKQISGKNSFSSNAKYD